MASNFSPSRESPSLSPGWEEVDTPSLEDLTRVQREFRTPKRLKLQPLLAVNAETLPMRLVMPEGLSQFEIPQSPNAQPEEYARAQMIGLETVLAEWHRVAENFDTLFAEFNKLGEGEKKYRLALSGSISNLQTALGEAKTRVQLLLAKVWADDVASEQGSLSMWECV
jgi:hypothetical protein